MCIIMAKPKGVKLPTKETFKICFTNNPDGCGYMYVENERVIVRKGFMGYKKMYKEIAALPDVENRAVVVHFRIGTSGKNDQKTCHPYPISKEVKDLQRCYYKTELAMVHNGIIPGQHDSNVELNDTQIFIKNVLTVYKKLNRKFYKYPEMQLLLEDVTNSKLAFLDSSEEITYVGRFIDSDGVKYSNYNYETTYKNYYLDDRYYDQYGYSDDTYSYYKGGKYYNRKLLSTTVASTKASTKAHDKYDDKTGINFDNYKIIEKGHWIVTAAGNPIEVEKDNHYGFDDRGNIFTVDLNGFPQHIIYYKGYVCDSNLEEVYI